MSLLTDLDAFFLEHRCCGDLETGVEENENPRVWMICTCGGAIGRVLTDRSER